MFNFITIGYDCSPAACLRNLNYRDHALPFDWVVSNVISIQKCFEDNFSKFHTNLKYNGNKTKLIDEYGFQFPHDYPLIGMDTDVSNNVGEGIFGEEKGKYICDKWIQYYDTVKEKYNRRIERFKNILNDTNPIIVLCRYNTRDVLQLQQLFLKYYNKDNIYFVNSSQESFCNNKIINIYTEKNDIWNDVNIWKPTIDNLKKNIFI